MVVLLENDGLQKSRWVWVASCEQVGPESSQDYACIQGRLSMNKNTVELRKLRPAELVRHGFYQAFYVSDASVGLKFC